MALELIDLVQATLLGWARNEARITLDDAAARLSVRPEDLAAWERGAAPPPMSDLKRLARLYGRSIGVFFLPQPPLES